MGVSVAAWTGAFHSIAKRGGHQYAAGGFPNPGETQVMRLRLEKLTATRFCGGFNLTAT
jgi:hypothetical protein